MRRRVFMARAHRWRRPATALGMSAAVVFAWPGPSGAHPATAAPKKSPLPLIRPRTGKAFVPVLGDWEGTVGGFPASFELRFDSALPRRAGIPQYGLEHLVVLRPATCPASSSHYAESVVSGQRPIEIGGYGSLGLASFGFGGRFAGRRSASLSSAYHARSCRGRLTWAMHAAKRAAVEDGTWHAQFADRESGRFQVLAGGRLATSLQLPNALASCSGLSGAVDLFIARDGRAKVTQPGLGVTVRFTRRSASGTMTAGQRGCPRVSIRFTAAHRSG